MAITFRCPKCKKQLQVKDELAGKKARCTCGTVIRVPSPAPPPPPSGTGGVPSLFDELTDLELSSSAAPQTQLPRAPVPRTKVTRPTSRMTSGSRRPPVVVWYIAYCLAMAVMYVAVAIGGLVIAGMAETMAGQDPEYSVEEVRMMGIVMFVVSAVCTVFFLIAPLIGRRPAGWFCGTVAIGIGLTGACCLPAAIPLIIFWLKPETKAYYRTR